jgi:predicted aspartyl protease
LNLTRRGALAAASLLVPGVASAASQAKFPFRMLRNRPWTAVAFNGRQPALPLLLDSGAMSFGVVDSRAAELGLRPWGRSLVQGAVGRASLPIYSADVLLGGAVRYEDVAVLGLDHRLDQLEGLAPLTRFNVMSFDFDALEVLVSRSLPDDRTGYMRLDMDPGEGDAGSLDRLGAFSRDSAYQEVRDHRPIISAEFDGQPVKLLLDTGATDSLFLFPDYVRARGLWDHYPTSMDGRFGTVAGVYDGKMVRAERFKLGRIVFANPIVTLGDPEDHGLDGNSVADGLVGMEFLRRLNFIFEPRKREIWIKPNKAIADGYRIDRSGAYVRVVDGEGRVVALQEGGPAARAGLRLNDKITGWRGHDGIEGLAWAMLGAPGSKVDIQVERSGKPQMISVVLEEPF